MARQRVLRKTKVIATIGPACDSVETLKAMIGAGMNVARLNFSHGNHEEHRKRLECIRQAAAELDANIGIMLDTQGAEIRTGRLAGGAVTLEAGRPFKLYTDGRVGGERGVAVSLGEVVEEVAPGSAILLHDGAIELRVVKVRAPEIQCEVVRGGRLADRKGVNLPGVSLGRGGMSPADRDDLLFAIEHDVTYIAASFVRKAADVLEIRDLLGEHGATIPIIAKIESREGVDNVDQIVAAADGTMVARGDLGVEIPLEEVPIVQKKLIRTTVMNGKPVITATQMLDSMERNPTPTRAEVSDVANAILDGTSAVMLSGETALGRHPVEAVRTMATLAVEAEAALPTYGYLQHILPEPANAVTEAVSQAAIAMANHLSAAAILVLTESGFTARSISKHRPSCAILALTPSPAVVQRLSMNWGVTALRHGGEPSDEALVASALRRARDLGYVASGDVVVATTGRDRQTGSTNQITVRSVE